MPRKLPHQLHRNGALAASMRPGLLCPGSIHIRPGQRYTEAASMRPGLLCPGRMVRCLSVFSLLSFNEAGAVMPRKSVGIS